MTGHKVRKVIRRGMWQSCDSTTWSCTGCVA